ncbi:MAG: hypothetical protein ABI193_15460 [Minicystis sp.]
MNASDTTGQVLQRLGSEYVTHGAVTMLASLEGSVPPALRFAPTRSELVAFEELRRIGYIQKFANGWSLTDIGKDALRRSLVPARPTGSALAVLEVVRQYDLEHHTRSVDHTQWISRLRLKKKMADDGYADVNDVVASLAEWYLTRITGGSEFFRLAKWGWIAVCTDKARVLIHGLVDLLWERYDQDIFDIHYTLEELRMRGAVSTNDDAYFVEELIVGFGLGQGDSNAGWSLPEIKLEHFVGLGCTSGDDYLDNRRIHEAEDKKFFAVVNRRQPPTLLPDLESIYYWRRTAEFAQAEPWLTPQPAHTPEAVWHTVNLLVDQFKHMIEDRNVWRILWDGGTPRPESTAQQLFYAIASGYCTANNLDITPEADTGRGRVDFKISSGFSARLLVELKLSNNARLVHGYETQLRLYKKAEQTTNAIYLIIDVGGKGQRLDRILELQRSAVSRGEVASKIVVVDAMQKDSGSVADDS